MKKIFCFLLIANSLNANAQLNKLPILLKGDFGSSNVKTNIGKGSSSFAYALGVETFIPLAKLNRADKIQLNPSLSYLHTSYGQSISFLAANPLAGKVNVNYISLVLPICYTAYGIETKNGQGLLVGIGPYFNVATDGNYQTLGGAVYNKKKINFGNALTDNRQRLDAGIAIKLGLLLNSRLYMGMQFNRGLYNTTPKDRVINGSFLKVRNNFFYASYLINNISKGR